MTNLESLFQRADFSKETNHKAMLREKLFGKANAVSLSFEDLEMVNAAGDSSLQSTKTSKDDKLN